MPLVVHGHFVNEKELDAIIKNLAEEYGPKKALTPIRAAARNTLKTMIPKLKAATPVRTGELRDSVKVFAGKRRGSKAVVSAAVGYVYPAGRGATPRVPQGLGVEYGSARNKRPQRPIRNTFDANENNLRQTMRKELAIAVNKSVKRWTREKGKGTFRYR